MHPYDDPIPPHPFCRLRRVALAALLALAFAAAPILQAEVHHPGLDRGIQANKVYDVLGLDTINTYNGNLTIRLPIGLSRANNGGMSWGLSLVYNGKNYDFRKERYPGDGYCTNPAFDYEYSMPTRHANAGLGWNVSLGRLVSADNPVNDEYILGSPGWSWQGCDPHFSGEKVRSACSGAGWSYEGSDGGQHDLQFNPLTGTGKTDDGSFLRSRYTQPEGDEPTLTDYSYLLIEFPDGSTQKFRRYGVRGDWRLVRMKDAFGNSITVSYLGDSSDNEPFTKYTQMTIADSFGRTTVIDFAPASAYTDSPVAEGYGRVVKSVTTDALDDTNCISGPDTACTSKRVVYTFDYEMHRLVGDGWFPPGTVLPNVLLLKSLDTPNVDANGTHTSYSFVNELDASGNATSRLSSMAVPAGGKIQWTYGSYTRSTSECDAYFSSSSPGVASRTLIDAAGATVGTWTYRDHLNFSFTCQDGCQDPDPYYHDNRDINGICSPEPKFYIYHRTRPEASVSVRSPEGKEVVQYHNIMPTYGSCTIGGVAVDGVENGLPFTRRPITAGHTYTRLINEIAYTYTEPKNPIKVDGIDAYLSSVTYTGCPAACAVEQATYVRYENDGPGGGWGGSYAANSRLQAQRTVIFDHDVTTNAENNYAVRDWSQVVNSDYDSYGHYRVATTSGYFAGLQPTRKTTTAYSPVVDDSTWFLQHADSSKVEENGKTALTLLCMANDGFVSARRVVSSTDGVSAADDVVTLFDRDATGNITTEHSGLATAAAGASICGTTITDQYKVTYTYEKGVAVSSTYQNTKGDIATFKMSNLTIEPTTGLVISSQDPAGVKTKVFYDTLGRLRFEKRGSTNGGAFLAGQTEYVYANWSSASSPAKVETLQRDRNGTTVLAYSRVEFDSFGRTARDVKKMADGTFSVRDTTYTPWGAVNSVSEAGTGAASSGKTQFTYDQLGRVTAITGPDGSVTTTAYSGGGKVTKTSRIHRKPNDLQAGAKGTLTEIVTQSDPFGRLASVTERSGAYNGSDYNPVTTTYSYDVGNRLATVSTTDDRTPSVTQTRRFTYDAAGFLRHEEHPELTAAGVPATDASTTEGITYGGYDAQGHAATKTTGSGTGAITLRYEYDSAERLRSVSDGANNKLETFTYDSLSGGTTCSTDCGRLLQSTRHNRFAEGDYTVTDKLTYDAAGRLGTKTTTIVSPAGTQSFSQDFVYNDLNLQSEIHFPTCTGGCTGANSLTTPDDNFALTYANGFLTAVGGFASSITYHPSGLVHKVQHVSEKAVPLITEIIEADDSGLPRPKSITFAGAQDCSAITVQPVGDTIKAGDALTLTVGTSADSSGLKFEWFQGNSGDESVPLTPAGGTNTLTVSPSVNTKYWVKVSDAAGGCATNSSTATVAVCTDVTILDHSPDTQTVQPGSSVTLSVTASGTNLSYQWYSGATALSGQTGPSYTATVTQPATFKVVVKEAGKCPSTAEANFTVNTGTCGPVIDVDLPLAPVLNPGASVPMTVHVVSDSPVTYEWHTRNGIVAGANGPTLGSSAPRDWDLIWVKVTNACGSAYSTHSHIRQVTSCGMPPLTVDQTSVDFYVTETNPTPNLTFTASVDWVQLTWQWYHGESGDTHDPVAGNADHPNQLTVQPLVGQYWVRVTTSCGAYEDSPTLIVYNGQYNCGPIQIVQQPADVVDSAAGAAHTLSVDTTSKEAPYVYEWDDLTHQQVAGSGKSVIVAPVVTTQYQVSALNTCGYVRSRIATVHVTSCADIALTAQPQDVSINAGDPPVALSVTASSGSQLGYQWYTGSSGDTAHPIAGATGPTLSVTPAQTTAYWVRVAIATPGGCAVDSRTATVWVCRTPVITKPPLNQTVASGQITWLSATATGDDITYQWYAGEVGDISAPAGGGWITSVVPTVTTKYWLKVTSACHGEPNASATAAATLSVCPTLEAPVAAKTLVMPGTSTTVSINAGGTYLTYKWYIGASGDLSHPFSNNANDGASINTGPISQQTKFWCAVSSGACTPQSADVTVDVCSGPSVSWGGAATQVAQGYTQMVPVSYLPVVDTFVTYYKGTPGDVPNSTVIAGPTTNAAVQLTATATATYWARATNGICYADSAPLTITVCVPTITTQPAGTMIDPGGAADLSVAANGGTLTYQWYVGSAGDLSQPVAGTAGQQPTLHVTPTSNTNYWVRVTGSCSQSVDSATATVSVCVPASIQGHPLTQTAQPGAQVTLSVSAQGTNLGYQWYQGGAGVTTTPVGTNASSLTITATTTTDYWVRVTGRCGSADSNVAKLSVPPAITAQPAPVSITSGTYTTLHVTASGTQLRYEWYQGVSGDTSHDLGGGTGFNAWQTPTLTADTPFWVRVYSGNAYTDSNTATVTICVNAGWSVTAQATGQPSGGNATLSAVNPDANTTYSWYQGNAGNTTTPLGSGSAIVVHPTQTTSYWMRATSATCYADSNTGAVVICTPAITAQPSPASVPSGTQVTLGVTATGTPTLTYQWYIGASGTTTSPISLATNSSLSVTPSSTTTYWCRVTNGTGGCYVNSNAATVTICNAPAVSASPQVLTPNAGQTSTLSVTASGVSPSYQWYVGTSGTTTQPFGTNTSSVGVGPQQTTDYWVKVTSSCGVVNSPSVKVSVTPIIGAQPADTYITSGTAATFTVSVSGAQLQYQWYRGAAGDLSNAVANATNATLVTGPLTANTTYWVKITSGLASAQSTAATAYICQGSQISINQPAGSPSGGTVTLSIVNPNGTDTYKWYRGNSGDTTNLVADTGTQSSVQVTPTQATNYWVRTTSATCYANSQTYTVSICTPKITQQPASTGTTGGNVTLTVAATGDPTLTYQWYQGTSGTTTTPVANATTSSLTVNPGQTTSYWVKVTNGAGGSACSVNSNTATVTVCSLPSITTQPVNQTLGPPSYSTTLSVGASGATSYQWFFGQPGDTTHQLTGVMSSSSVSNAGFTDTTYIWVRVSNACGSVNSNAALISVRPTIYGITGDIHLTAGSMATWNVSASGSQNHYSWWLNNVQVTNNDSPTLTTQVNANASVAVYVTSGNAQSSTGTSATICDAVHITSGPTKQTSGSCRYLTVYADDPSATYQWFQGARGVTTTPVGTANSVTVCPTTATTYWCRVTAGDGSGCYTDSAAITAP